jgi:hypothetical protein
MTDKREPTLREARKAMRAACPCRSGDILCPTNDPLVTDCRCAEQAGYGSAAPDVMDCRWSGHAAICALERAARRGGHRANCKCVFGNSGNIIVIEDDPACAEWRENGEPDAE